MANTRIRIPQARPVEVVRIPSTPSPHYGRWLLVGGLLGAGLLLGWLSLPVPPKTKPLPPLPVKAEGHKEVVDSVALLSEIDQALDSEEWLLGVTLAHGALRKGGDDPSLRLRALRGLRELRAELLFEALSSSLAAGRILSARELLREIPKESVYYQRAARLVPAGPAKGMPSEKSYRAKEEAALSGAETRKEVSKVIESKNGLPDDLRPF